MIWCQPGMELIVIETTVLLMPCWGHILPFTIHCKTHQSILSFYSIALTFYGFQGLFEKEVSIAVTMLWRKLCARQPVLKHAFSTWNGFWYEVLWELVHAGNPKSAIKIFLNSNHLFLLMEKWFNGCTWGDVKSDIWGITVSCPRALEYTFSYIGNLLGTRNLWQTEDYDKPFVCQRTTPRLLQSNLLSQASVVRVEIPMSHCWWF